MNIVDFCFCTVLKLDAWTVAQPKWGRRGNAPPKQTCHNFYWCFKSIFNCMLGNKRKEQSDLRRHQWLTRLDWPLKNKILGCVTVHEYGGNSHSISFEAQSLAKIQSGLKVVFTTPLSMVSNNIIAFRYSFVRTCVVTVQSKLYGVFIF